VQNAVDDWLTTAPDQGWHGERAGTVVNRDGSFRRSGVTDDELEAVGQMSRAAWKAHTQLCKDWHPRKCVRLVVVPDDDPWYVR
jgi:hypothetical protein